MACYITIYILAKQMTSIHPIWLLALTEWLHDNGRKSERYREIFAPSNGRISEPFQSLTAARPCNSVYYKLSNHIATGYKCRYPILVKYNQQLYKITTHCHNTVEPPITDPPTSGQPLYNGHWLWHGLTIQYN